MKRKATFYFFLGTVIAVGFYFFQLVQPFLLPLLMAGTLALLVQPLFTRCVALTGGRRRLAAMLMSVLTVMVIVIPMTIALMLATQELIRYGGEVVQEVQRSQGSETAELLTQLKHELSEEEFGRLTQDILNDKIPRLPKRVDSNPRLRLLMEHMARAQPSELKQGVRLENGAAFFDPESIPLLNSIQEFLAPYVGEADMRKLRDSTLAMGQAMLTEVYEKTSGALSNLLSFLIGFAVTLLAFYYFLAEGPMIVDELENLLPFEPEDEVAVVKQFETICRGVVLGTLVAAVAQASLLGGALAILGIPGAWLLTCLTVILSMIPFVGAGGVYLPVALHLFWADRTGAAIFLLLYGIFLVSVADNLIRAYMIHGTSRLHPLIALISALGALQVVGLWGIIVGPVVAGIFYALLKILQQKLNRLERQSLVEG